MDGMLKMDGVSTSNPNATATTARMTTTGSGTTCSRADDTFRIIVQEMILQDGRFKGMAGYVSSIEFFWSSAIGTTCAGAGFIFFNPDFWAKLFPEQQKTVVAHEIWHLICKHLQRGEGLDPESYNIASDHFINLTLQEDGFLIHKGADFGGIEPCCDPQYRGMSSEQIYAKVHADRKKDLNSHSAPSGTPSKDQIEDLIKEALRGSGKSMQQQQDEDEEAVNNAVDQCNNAPPGDQPGGEARILETVGKRIFVKEATYEEIFEPYLTDPLSGGKRTYIRPSRRQTAGGLRLKGKFPKRGRKNRLTHLVYALDVSGSKIHATTTRRR